MFDIKIISLRYSYNLPNYLSIFFYFPMRKALKGNPLQGSGDKCLPIALIPAKAACDTQYTDLPARK